MVSSSYRLIRQAKLFWILPQNLGSGWFAMVWLLGYRKLLTSANLMRVWWGGNGYLGVRQWWGVPRGDFPRTETKSVTYWNTGWRCPYESNYILLYFFLGVPTSHAWLLSSFWWGELDLRLVSHSVICRGRQDFHLVLVWWQLWFESSVCLGWGVVLFWADAL